MSASNYDGLMQQPNGTASSASRNSGTGATTDNTAKPGISKEEYLAKQNQIFEELTGFKSWDSWRQGVKDGSDSELDHNALMYALKLTMTALDEDTFNEVVFQRSIDEEYKKATEIVKAEVERMPTKEAKLERLASNFRYLREDLCDIEVQFLSSRKVVTNLVETEAQLKSELEASGLTNQRLTAMCSALKSKIQFMTADCERHQDENQRLRDTQAKMTEVIKKMSNADFTNLESRSDVALQWLNKIADDQAELRKELQQAQESLKSVSSALPDIKNMSYADVVKENEILKRQKEDLEKRNTQLQKESLQTKALSKQNDTVQVKQESEPPINSLDTADLSDYSAAKLEHHPLLQDMIKKFEIQGNPDPVEEQMAAVRREYPELLSGKLRAFYEQYEAREQYFLQANRVNKLQALVVQGKLDREVRRGETDAKRLEVLSGQVEESSKVEANLRSQITHLESLLERLETGFKNATQDMVKKQENDEYLMTYLDKMSELATSMNERNEEFNAECDTLRDNVEVLIQERKRNEEMSAEYHKQFTAHKSLSSAIALERDQLEFTIAKLEAEMAQLHGKMAAKTAQNKTLDKKLRDTETELAGFRVKDSEKDLNGNESILHAEKTHPATSDSSLANIPEEDQSNPTALLPEPKPSSPPPKETQPPQVDFASLTPEQTAQKLYGGFNAQPNPAEFFQKILGFDITSVPVHEWLEHYTHTKSCTDKGCSIHSQEAKFRQGWSSLLKQVQGIADGSIAGPPITPLPRFSPPPSNSNGKMINGKRVFGPERPPSMQA